MKITISAGRKRHGSKKAVCPCLVREVSGEERLRFFDLGFFRGSRVLPMYECTGGGTRVYRVKDTLIALRDRDAAQILAEEAGSDG